MKTKYWIALFLAVALVCGGLTLWLFNANQNAATAEVWSGGKLIKTVSLQEDQTFTVTSGDRENVITVKDGAIAVTQANCPDKHCIHRGYCSGGAQIVCLPNELVIKFVGKQTIDGVSG